MIFKLESTHANARAGLLTLSRGVVETPMFMPVGTQASIKGLSVDEVKGIGYQLILANTYHLWLRPGAELIHTLGGVQRFMAWPHAMLTDSGGYQVFSLAEMRKIDDDGARFRSHLDGSYKVLTPEESMRVQALLGSDIAMVLDECPPAQSERAVIENAMRRTTLWAKRSLACAHAEHQARFVIVQGGVHMDLRERHLAELAELPAQGMALGGFSVGEPPEVMHEMLQTLAPKMPADKPRYLMGVGTPTDLLYGVLAGVDIFDCVMPTRNARNGQAFTWHGRVNLRQARHKEDPAPLDERCGCPVCNTHTRAYLRHLFLAKEMLGPRLLTLHNLYFYHDLMRQARAAVIAGRYEPFMRETLAAFAAGDEVGEATLS